MARAFISVGSNIDPAENIKKAVRMLVSQVQIVGISTVYLTEAVGRAEQPPFYNCVIEMETELPPLDLKNQVLRRTEEGLGRKRVSDKFAPRTIDLDLIHYGETVLEEGGLKLPDPDILRRPFLAVPLFELAPGMKLPGYDVSIKDLVETLSREGMRPLDEFTESLRRDIDRGHKH